MAATAGDETATTGGVMYTDEGELEFDEDEMAALEGQCLVAEFRCGIVSRFRVWAELRRLPCEWAGRKSQWRRRQWIGSGHLVEWWWRHDGLSEWCGGSRSIPDEPYSARLGFVHMARWSMRQAPLHMRFFARSCPMSCLPFWWRKPTGTMTRLLLH